MSAGTSLPEGRAGRWLALGLLALALALAWLGLAAPLWDWQAEAAARVERKALVLQRTRALVESLPALRASVAALPAGMGSGDAVLAGATDAVAGAALQGMLRQITAGSREIQLSSLETLPVEEVGGFRRIGLRVSGSAAWPALLEMLRQIDAARPVLLLDSLAVRAPPAGLARSVPDLPVELSFALHGYRATEAPP